jgi:hypothetical protein
LKYEEGEGEYVAHILQSLTTHWAGEKKKIGVISDSSRRRYKGVSQRKVGVGFLREKKIKIKKGKKNKNKANDRGLKHKTHQERRLNTTRREHRLRYM